MDMKNMVTTSMDTRDTTNTVMMGMVMKATVMVRMMSMDMTTTRAITTWPTANMDMMNMGMKAMVMGLTMSMATRVMTMMNMGTTTTPHI